MAAAEQIRAPQMGQSAVRSPNQHDHHNGRQARRAQGRAARLFNRISLGFCCVASFVAVWLVANSGAAVYKASYENTRLQTQIQQQSAINATLDANVAQLKQPARILREATKLGMQSTKPTVIPVPSGK
ncbi:septum formation initiator family protein [Alicyclobacillus dauci]|uniref:Septum formation initiator family protein n=1 Tax=Alicyclobacillus dauci TaxID=1475485 RepID=A0ABY6YY50_9BACL|nr:septum formation initiator family protein [Alicyclobacillus dauci]WAH35539.1 septum formation initiator family protein [Alicyclobacillus dauci]